MPIYKFKCTDCGYEFDNMQSMSASNPSCPSKGVRILQSLTYLDEKFVPGFGAGVTQVHIPAEGGRLVVVDRSHFIDPDGKPRGDDPPLKGYVQAVCGAETKKLIARGSFHLKGGGWYRDGY